MKRRKSYCTNLHHDYVRNWTKREAIREYVANARDEGEHELTFPDEDTIIVESVGNPQLFHLFAIGATTKANNPNTIGEFGEGGKLAALVLTRERGCSVEIHCQQGRITFAFKERLGTKMLFAVYDDEDVWPVFKVTIHAPKAKEIYEDLFLAPDVMVGRIELMEQGKVRVFCKGVFITTLEETGLFDWNVDNLTLNRDRSVPNHYSIQSGIGRLLDGDLPRNPALCDKLISNTHAFELNCLAATWMGDSAKAALTQAFYRRFGDKAILSSGDLAPDQLAAHRGFKPITLPGHLGSMLDAKKVGDIISLADKLEPSDLVVSPAMMEELEYIIDRLNVPCLIQVAKDDGETDGFASWTGTKAEVWLNERLLMPGCRKDRIRTLCHELGHLKDNSGDGQIPFEISLTDIAGTLAVALLESKQGG